MLEVFRLGTPFHTDILVAEDSALFSMCSPRLPSSAHLGGKGESLWRIDMRCCCGPGSEVERTKSRGLCNLQGQLGVEFGWRPQRKKKRTCSDLLAASVNLVLRGFHLTKGHSPGEL